MIHPRPALEGTVIAVSPTEHESPDFNWPSFGNRVLLLGELITVPLLALAALLSLGPLSLVLTVVALVVLLRFISPSALLGNLLVLRLVRPGRRSSERIPVQYLRVRDSASQEHMIRRKGIGNGHIMPGDEVALWGRFHHGILHFARGRNTTTGTDLTSPRNNSRAILALHLVVLGILMSLFAGPIHRILEVLA